MAFMMPVVKNDWDIYNSQRSRRTSESAEKAGLGGRVRKVSESRSEGPALSPQPRSGALSPHRSAPAMRSLSYCRAPHSRVSLRTASDSPSKGSGSPPNSGNSAPQDKFHTRLVEKLKRALGRSESRREERSSWLNECLCAGRARPPRSGIATRGAAPACPTCDGRPPPAGPTDARRHTICDMFPIVNSTSWVDVSWMCWLTTSVALSEAGTNQYHFWFKINERG